MVEQHRTKVGFKCRSHKPPHVLVAPETMCEHHGARTIATFVHVIATDYRHVLSRPSLSEKQSISASRARRFGRYKKILYVCHRDGKLNDQL
jgi:hypothetical protein